MSTQSNSITVGLTSKVIPNIIATAYDFTCSFNPPAQPTHTYDIFVNGSLNQKVTTDANGNATFHITSTSPTWPVVWFAIPE